MIDFAPADPSGPHNARFDRLILEGHAGETGSRHVDVDRITEMVLQRGDSGRGDRAVPGEELGMARCLLERRPRREQGKRGADRGVRAPGATQQNRVIDRFRRIRPVIAEVIPLSVSHKIVPIPNLLSIIRNVQSQAMP
jgi:hypothetical protein